MTTSWQAEPGTSTPCHSESVPNRQVSRLAGELAHQLGQRSSPWHRIGRSSRAAHRLGRGLRPRAWRRTARACGRRRPRSARRARRAAASRRAVAAGRRQVPRRRRGCPASGSRRASRRRGPASSGPTSWAPRRRHRSEAQRPRERLEGAAELERRAGQHDRRRSANSLLAQQSADRTAARPQRARPRRGSVADARRRRTRASATSARRRRARRSTVARACARACLRAASSASLSRRRASVIAARAASRSSASAVGEVLGHLARGDRSAVRQRRGERRAASASQARPSASSTCRRGAPGRAVDGRRRELAGGGAGDAVDQLVRLVDDHHVVLGQHRRCPRCAPIASSAWLVTTTSRSRARSRAVSAKHSSPYGHLVAPRHSRPTPRPGARRGRRRRGRARRGRRSRSRRPTRAAAATSGPSARRRPIGVEQRLLVVVGHAARAACAGTRSWRGP